MTLTPFKRKLMKFIHTLTRFDFFPSDDDIAKRMNVTRKTIQNWFRYCSEPYSYKDFNAQRKLSYFPAIKKNMLGLEFITVLFYNARRELAFLWPNKNYLGRLFDLTDRETVLIVEYLVPKSQVEAFKRLLPKLVEMNLCSKTRVYDTSPSFTMYVPFHEVIDETGKFHYDKVSASSVLEEKRKLRAFLDAIGDTDTSYLLQKNPLIIPVIAEYQYEQRKSVQVWNAIKRKLGNDVWDYIPTASMQSDGVGIQAVQDARRNLSRSGLLTQMRIVYFPLQFRGFCFWMILEYGDLEDLVELAGKWLQYSHTLNVFRIGRRRALVTSVLNGESLQSLFNVLSRVRLLRAMIFDMSRGLELITDAAHAVFDYRKMFSPKEYTWKLDMQELEYELESMP